MYRCPVALPPLQAEFGIAARPGLASLALTSEFGMAVELLPRGSRKRPLDSSRRVSPDWRWVLIRSGVADLSSCLPRLERMLISA